MAASATIRDFLDADLVDTMHIAVEPIELARGERLWTSHQQLLDRFHLYSVPSPSGVTTYCSGTGNPLRTIGTG